MNQTSRLPLGWPTLVAAAVVLLAVGTGTTYVIVRPRLRPQIAADRDVAAAAAQPNATAVPRPDGVGSQGALPDVVVSLSPEAVKRAGIVIAPVTSGTGTSAVRLPAVVEPNAYKQVVVTPLVAGRVTRVLVELGQSVRRGQAMADISARSSPRRRQVHFRAC